MSEKEMEPFHGAQKIEVIEHFAARQARHGPFRLKEQIAQVDAEFQKSIAEAYFAPNSGIKLIHPDLPQWSKKLRDGGVLITLNTGYSREIQNRLVENLELKPLIDDYISSEDVRHGRPYPYMIHRLMERFSIENVKHVAKVCMCVCGYVYMCVHIYVGNRLRLNGGYLMGIFMGWGGEDVDGFPGCRI